MSSWICEVISSTPAGAVSVVSAGDALLSLVVGYGGVQAAWQATRKRLEGFDVRLGENEAAAQVREYFAGKRKTFRLEPVLDTLPPFYRKALAVCAAIPYGETLTYGEVARRAGSPRASRAVGQALHRNPTAIVIPCHRVLGRDGIGGFSAPGGVATKRALLSLEGLAGVRCSAK